MGALTSKPKSLPTVQPETITVETAPAVATTTASDTGAATSTAGTGTSGDPSSAAPTDADTEAAARQDNLLERSHGLLSTVLTGFDGVLNSVTTPARKSLLGE